MTSSEDVTRTMPTSRHRRARDGAVAGLVAACLCGGVVALAVSDGSDDSDPDRTALLGPGTSDTTLPYSSVPYEQDIEPDADTSTSNPDEAPTTPPPSAPAHTGTLPQKPTTTEPTTTEPTTATVTSPTTVASTTPYDVVIDIPASRDSRGWPMPPSPDYWLVGDPSMLRGNSSDGAGCVWLEDEAGTRISILWPPGWTARLRGHGTEPPHVTLRDRRGKVQATNDQVLGIVGGEVDKPIPFCDVGEKTFEVLQLDPQ